MTKKNRLIILFVCALFFLVITSSIVLYSLGYRIDFEQKKITATGGIYLKVWPQPAEFFVDSKNSGKTKIFSDSIFIQNLLPKQHNVLIKKEGYFPYQKILDIKEKEVVKLEHIILFKENITFEILKNEENSPFKKQDDNNLFFIKDGGLYKNNLLEKPSLVLKNLAAFRVAENSIIWLGLDGFVYSSDISGEKSEKISSSPLKINKNSSYKIETVFQNIFLFENNHALLLSQKTKEFLSFYDPVKKIEISPNGQKVVFYNDYEILFSYIWKLQESENPEKIFLNRFSEKIGQCVWLNNDYIIFTISDRIKISEIDNKNNLNIITLPEISAFSGQNPEIYFNQQEKKLYALFGDKILISEKIAP
ncbi:MAG: hypothetical protein AAB361_01755 [Patescibacteria group bacterium]